MYTKSLQIRDRLIAHVYCLSVHFIDMCVCVCVCVCRCVSVLPVNKRITLIKRLHLTYTQTHIHFIHTVIHIYLHYVNKNTLRAFQTYLNGSAYKECV